MSLTVAGGVSTFRESAADLRLESNTRLDPHGNAFSIRAAYDVRNDVAVEAGVTRFGKMSIVTPFIDGVRTMETRHLGVRWCPTLDSSWYVCAAPAWGRTVRVIEDRLAREPDAIGEVLFSAAVGMCLSARTSVLLDWTGTQKSRVSAWQVGVRLNF